MPIVIGKQCIKIADYLFNLEPNGKITPIQFGKALSIFGGSTDKTRDKYRHGMFSMKLIKKIDDNTLQLDKEMLIKTKRIFSGEFYDIQPVD